ncbi:uncharacterized protein LOC143881193 [Tasmannia lanceolata]|uniref:uncharacterized protein LOC143881193 n=1 Tax=Tasmannia lanceolata TaxID=3420 RepID=UPI004064A3F3
MDSHSTASSGDLSLQSDARYIPTNPLPEFDAPVEDSENVLMPPPANDPIAKDNTNFEKQDSSGKVGVRSPVCCTSSGEGSVGSSVTPAMRCRNTAPNCLPAGWHTKVKVENSGVMAGTEDRSSRSSRHHKEGVSRPNVKKAMKFNYDDTPETVTWTLTNPAEGSWTPFIGEEMVSESTKKEWEAAFEHLIGGPN